MTELYLNDSYRIRIIIFHYAVYFALIWLSKGNTPERVVCKVSGDATVEHLWKISIHFPCLSVYTFQTTSLNWMTRNETASGLGTCLMILQFSVLVVDRLLVCWKLLQSLESYMISCQLLAKRLRFCLALVNELPDSMGVWLLKKRFWELTSCSQESHIYEEWCWEIGALKTYSTLQYFKWSYVACPASVTS